MIHSSVVPFSVNKHPQQQYHGRMVSRLRYSIHFGQVYLLPRVDSLFRRRRVNLDRFLLRSFLFQPINTTPNTAISSGLRSRPAVWLGLSNRISHLLQSFILTALLSTFLVTFRPSLHLQNNTPNIRSVRPRACVRRWDCSSATDAHPMQFWKWKKVRGSWQFRESRDLSRQGRKKRTERKWELDRGQESKGIRRAKM